MRFGLPHVPARLLAGLALWCAGAVGTSIAGEVKPKTVADGETLAQACVGCHGQRGVSSVPAVPSLAGQHAEYLIHALGAFQQGLRVDPTMNTILGQYSSAELRQLAKYYAAQPYVRPPQEISAQKLARGRMVVAKVCVICHPDGGKESSYAEYPRLAGQSLTYLQKSMADILAYRRPVDAIMLGMIYHLSLEDLDSALHFFAGQPVETTITQGAQGNQAR